MYQIELEQEVKQLQAALQKDKNLLGTTLTRIFDTEARMQKIKAELKDRQSAKLADWEKPEYAAARFSLCFASGQ